MLPPAAERAKLAAVLEGLAGSVEELLLSGLTTASEATRLTLADAMREAARFRLLRLGSTLRGASEELARFGRQDPAFSRRRLSFFLDRAWLLSRGLGRAVRDENEAEYDRLAWTPPARPLPMVEVVCLGVLKKVAAGSFAAFEFRLRAVADAGPIAAGARLSWSTVFPLKPGLDFPADGFLSLPQKQKFRPTVFLEGATVVVRDAVVSTDEHGGGRLALSDGSTVTAGAKFEDWPRYLDWSPRPALERLERHKPGPLDLETELQEEVVLRDYEVGDPVEGDETGQLAYPIRSGPLELRAVAGPEVESKPARAGLELLRKPDAKRPPLFGLMHYERCRLVLQPLSTIGPDGPDHLTISKDKVDKAALLKAMSFN